MHLRGRFKHHTTRGIGHSAPIKEYQPQRGRRFISDETNKEGNLQEALASTTSGIADQDHMPREKTIFIVQRCLI